MKAFLAVASPIHKGVSPSLVVAIAIELLIVGSHCTRLTLAGQVSTTSPTGTQVPAKSHDRTCTIRGTVRDAGSGEPLAGVRIQGFGKGASSTTDSQGKFKVDGLAAGRNTLMVFPQSLVYSYERRQLFLMPGEEIGNLDFELKKNPVLSGRVLDKNGRPVVGITVVARPISYLFGRMGLGYSASTTNDIGEYRLTVLGPSRTYISAEPKKLTIRKRAGPQGALQQEEGSTTEKITLANVSTHYPGSRTLEGASLIEVGAGEHREGLDIVLLQERTFCVFSSVSAQGSVDLGSPVTAELVEAIPTNMSRVATGVVRPGEEFEVCGIPVGAYRLFASATDSNGVASYGAETFYLAGRNIKVPALSLAPLEPVSGNITIDAPDKNRLVPAGMQVWLETKDRNAMPFIEGTRANVQPDGGFVIPAVTRDEYWLHVSGLPNGLYVKAAKMNGLDISGEPLIVGAGQLTIVLGTDAASLSGRVVNKDDRPVAGATVHLAVLPLPVKAKLGEVQAALTDQYGQFEFSGLAPGEYAVLASSDPFVSSMGSVQWFSQNRAKATKVSLSPNGSVRTTLQDLPLAVTRGLNTGATPHE